MVEEAGHGDALLQAGGEDITPFLVGVPAARTVNDLRDGNGFEEGEEVGVGGAFAVHFAQGVGIYDLLAQGAAAEVGPLGDVEDGARGGFADGTAIDGPEAAEDAEQGGFAAAVRANDEEMVTGLDGKVEGAYEDVAVGGDNRDVDEFNIKALDDGATAGEDRGVGGVGGAHEAFLEVASGDIVHDFEEGRDARGVAGELRYFFIGKHDATNGIGGGEEHTAIGDEAYDLSK